MATLVGGYSVLLLGEQFEILWGEGQFRSARRGTASVPHNVRLSVDGD